MLVDAVTVEVNFRAGPDGAGKYFMSTEGGSQDPDYFRIERDSVILGIDLHFAICGSVHFKPRGHTMR